MDTGVVLVFGIDLCGLLNLLKATSSSVGNRGYERVVGFALLFGRWVDVGFAVLCLFAVYA